MDEQNIDLYTKSEFNDLLGISQSPNENEMQIDFYTKSEVDELIKKYGNTPISDVRILVDAAPAGSAGHGTIEEL